MSRRIDQCELQVQRESQVLLKASASEWATVTSLSDVEWTGFAPAGCGVDQGRVIAQPDQTDPADEAGSPLLDPDAPDRQWRLRDSRGEVLFQFLGFVDDRRPRKQGYLVLGISTTPELLGAWSQLSEPQSVAAD